MEFLELVLIIIWVFAKVVVTRPLYILTALAVWFGILKIIDIILERWH